jgi:hypothetical protein
VKSKPRLRPLVYGFLTMPTVAPQRSLLDGALKILMRGADKEDCAAALLEPCIS